MSRGMLIGILVLVAAFLCGTSFHSISEGHVGVYYRWGKLLPTYTEPGLHWMMPGITRVHEVQVTLQTDFVTNIPCGTSGGVLIHFDKIEVVNRLKKEHVIDTIRNYSLDYDQTWIFQKVHHEMNQFCSVHTLQEVFIDKFSSVDDLLKSALAEGCAQWAPGLEIISVRISKARIPQEIMDAYIKMETEKARLLVSKQTQFVVQKEAETQRLKAVIEAEMRRNVSEINNQQMINEETAKQKVEEIRNKIYLEQQRTLSDAAKYAAVSEAEANKLKLTPEYLALVKYNAIANNTKIFFGEKIPTFVPASSIRDD